MSRCWSIGCLAVLATGWTLCVLNSRPNEPLYAGKTADQWLNAGFEDTCSALHEIGPPAFPYVLKKLRLEDSHYGSQQKYRQFFSKLPPSLQRALPKPAAGTFDELHACSALLELGPRIIPLLTTGLRDHNPVVRDVCAHALGSFQRQGKNISKSVPFLVEAEADQIPEVRARAAWAVDAALQNTGNREELARCKRSYPQGLVPGVTLGALPQTSR
jgi:hypothetical protein